MSRGILIPSPWWMQCNQQSWCWSCWTFFSYHWTTLIVVCSSNQHVINEPDTSKKVKTWSMRNNIQTKKSNILHFHGFRCHILNLATIYLNLFYYTINNILKVQINGAYYRGSLEKMFRKLLMFNIKKSRHLMSYIDIL